MIGIILVLFAGFFEEISNSLGKKIITEKVKEFFIVGFLYLFWTTAIFFAIALFRGEFIFKLASLPFFIPRAILEIMLAHVGLVALREADRSTFSFVRIITIPLLLAVDFILGYSITATQFLGIIIIVLSLIILMLRSGLNFKGIGYTIFTAIVAVITLSLYKYNITHFNSVEAEEGVIYLILTIYFMIRATSASGELPFSYLKKPKYIILSATRSLAAVVGSFAYIFAPATVIVAGRRAASVFLAVLSGHFYFRERHVLKKLAAFIGVVAGIILLAL